MLSEIYDYDIISNDTVNPPSNGLMESYYYLTDHLGSITEIVDENIEIVGIAQYSSFGSLLSSAGIFTEQPYGYTSREHDIESDLYYYRARYYDPRAGRFLQEDPIENAVYIYVNNNPIMYMDPSGLIIKDLKEYCNSLAIFSTAIVGGMTIIQIGGGALIKQEIKHAMKEIAQGQAILEPAPVVGANLITTGHWRLANTYQMEKNLKLLNRSLFAIGVGITARMIALGCFCPSN